jgi:HK97 family phage prohead protease
MPASSMMMCPTMASSIEGYAVLYDVVSIGGIDGNPLCERIARGAFDSSIRQATAGTWNIFALAEHDRKRKLGSTRRGTLTLRSDERGVRFRLLGRKLPPGFRGMSFQFVPLRWRQDGDLLFTLLEGALLEISVCRSRVCYPQTFVTVKETHEHE